MKVRVFSLWNGSLRQGGCLLSALLCVFLEGCFRQGAPDGASTGSLSIPPAGSVRILARKIREDADAVHWTWTLIGDRNWIACEGRGYAFSLRRSYPLNSTTQTGGTHIWEFDLSVQAGQRINRAASFRSVREALRLRGSHSASVESSMTANIANVPVSSWARAVQTGETTRRLPTDITLATVGRQRVELSISR
jgi:hypothetical protein